MELLNHCFFVLQLNEENKLYKSSVMVTAGANQVRQCKSLELFIIMNQNWQESAA